ncbi:hypothetical protein DUNSADRAFT_1551, partial [Dunaliella salina]
AQLRGSAAASAALHFTGSAASPISAALPPSPQDGQKLSLDGAGSTAAASAQLPQSPTRHAGHALPPAAAAAAAAHPTAAAAAAAHFARLGLHPDVSNPLWYQSLLSASGSRAAAPPQDLPGASDAAGRTVGELGDGTACLTTTHSLPGRPSGRSSSGTHVDGNSNSSSSDSSSINGSDSGDGSSGGDSSSSDGGVRWGAKGGRKWKRKEKKRSQGTDNGEGREGGAGGSQEKRKRRAGPEEGLRLRSSQAGQEVSDITRAAREVALKLDSAVQDFLVNTNSSGAPPVLPNPLTPHLPFASATTPHTISSSTLRAHSPLQPGVPLLSSSGDGRSLQHPVLPLQPSFLQHPGLPHIQDSLQQHPGLHHVDTRPGPGVDGPAFAAAGAHGAPHPLVLLAQQQAAEAQRMAVQAQLATEQLQGRIREKEEQLATAQLATEQQQAAEAQRMAVQAQQATQQLQGRIREKEAQQQQWESGQREQQRQLQQQALLAGPSAEAHPHTTLHYSAAAPPGTAPNQGALLPGFAQKPDASSLVPYGSSAAPPITHPAPAITPSPLFPNWPGLGPVPGEDLPHLLPEQHDQQLHQLHQHQQQHQQYLHQLHPQQQQHQHQQQESLPQLRHQNHVPQELQFGHAPAIVQPQQQQKRQQQQQQEGLPWWQQPSPPTQQQQQQNNDFLSAHQQLLPSSSTGSDITFFHPPQTTQSQADAAAAAFHASPATLPSQPSDHHQQQHALERHIDILEVEGTHSRSNSCTASTHSSTPAAAAVPAASASNMRFASRPAAPPGLEKLQPAAQDPMLQHSATKPHGPRTAPPMPPPLPAQSPTPLPDSQQQALQSGVQGHAGPRPTHSQSSSSYHMPTHTYPPLSSMQTVNSQPASSHAAPPHQPQHPSSHPQASHPTHPLVPYSAPPPHSAPPSLAFPSSSYSSPMHEGHGNGQPPYPLQHAQPAPVPEQPLHPSTVFAPHGQHINTALRQTLPSDPPAADTSSYRPFPTYPPTAAYPHTDATPFAPSAPMHAPPPPPSPAAHLHPAPTAALLPYPQTAPQLHPQPYSQLQPGPSVHPRTHTAPQTQQLPRTTSPAPLTQAHPLPPPPHVFAPPAASTSLPHGHYTGQNMRHAPPLPPTSVLAAPANHTSYRHARHMPPPPSTSVLAAPANHTSYRHARHVPPPPPPPPPSVLAAPANYTSHGHMRHMPPPPPTASVQAAPASLKLKAPAPVQGDGRVQRAYHDTWEQVYAVYQR